MAFTPQPAVPFGSDTDSERISHIFVDFEVCLTKIGGIGKVCR